MMNKASALLISTGLFVAGSCQPVWAGSFDIGLGLGFADSQDSDGFEGGLDLQAGYERRFSDNWNLGGQIHLIHGLTSKSEIDAYSDTSMYFQSTALYATARPQNRWLKWLQLKGGIVSADYKSQTVEGSGTGVALGAGVVIGGDKVRFHVLDIYRYQVGGDSFNIYTISIAYLFPLIQSWD